MTKNSLIRRLRERRGLNLIELSIVMAVVGLIVGGIYVAASSVYRNVRESTIQDDVLQIVQNVRSTYGVQGSMTAGSLAAASLIAAGIVPSDMVQTISGTTTVVDAFGGAVTVAGAPGTTPPTFTIELDQLPQSVCSDLAAKASQSGTQGATNVGLVSLTLGGNAILAAAFPVDPATAATDCGASPTTLIYNYTVR